MDQLDPLISRRSVLVRTAAAALAASGSSPAMEPSSRPAQKPPSPGDAIFDRPTLLDISLRVSPEGEASLRKEPRAWVRADATVDHRDLSTIAVHLKGATSFLPLDKRPSFTLGIDHYLRNQRLFGLRTIHLNNSVQDSTCLCEDLTGSLFRQSGVPCARVAWAKVRLNDRDLGLYVLKEHLGEDFLSLNFGRTDGNFYDGGLHHDLWEPLRLDSGRGPRDHSDLKALYSATQIADPAARWPILCKLADIDRFVSMMAMESLTHHIDGYSLMQNNYRIYFDPASSRAVFIVHGLDRMFEEPKLPLEPPWRGVLSKAIFDSPEGRRRFRRRLHELFAEFFRPEQLNARMDAALRLLAPAAPLVVPQAHALRQRIMTRVAVVREKLDDLRSKS